MADGVTNVRGTIASRETVGTRWHLYEFRVRNTTDPSMPDRILLLPDTSSCGLNQSPSPDHEHIFPLLEPRIFEGFGVYDVWQGSFIYDGADAPLPYTWDEFFESLSP